MSITNEATTLKLISWNVNGFRAVLGKGFESFFNSENADIFCLQEIKMQEGQADFVRSDYHAYYNYADKKGYSGVAIFTKILPISVRYGLFDGKYNDEGRIITLEFDNFYLINSYTPNAQSELARLDYRMEFEDTLREYMFELQKNKPVILCGDLNVAHMEIDLKNPTQNVGNPGFSPQEREKMTKLLHSGFVDTFRYLYPNKEDAYTWWSYRAAARPRNIGWRIDYFIASEVLKSKIVDAKIHSEVLGSDHCPVSLEIKI